MLNLSDIYLAEYSIEQGAFHVETAREAMENNLQQILTGWSNGYIPFAICASRAEASHACRVLAAQLKTKVTT